MTNKIMLNVDTKTKYKYFLLTFDDAYVFEGGGISNSIVKNTNENVCFIVFTESLSYASIEILKSYSIPFIIYFLSLDEINYNTNKHINWPKISVIRLLAPYIIEEETDYLYYLDCDFLCINKLDDLFKLKINTSVAICPEVSGNIRQQCLSYSTDNLYCNSGFILFNINKYKETYTKEKIIHDLNNMIENFSFPDQDFLNVYFINDVTYLNPLKYNNQIYEYIGFKGHKHDLLDNTIFIHFSVGKPWKNYCNPNISKIYKKYNVNKDMERLVNKSIREYRLLYLPRFIKRCMRKAKRICLRRK